MLNDGWIEWKGDRALPPVEVDALVEVRLRGGKTIKREAKYFAWSNGVGNRSYDIIAYRVIKNDGGTKTNGDELERQKFEKWLKSKGHRADRDTNGDYFFAYAASTWSGWMARSKQEEQ